MSLTTGGNGHEPHYDLPEPRPDFGPDDVVRIVLDALQDNDNPGPDCGIRTTFNFASPSNRSVTGPLSRFAEMVKNSLYGILIGWTDAKIDPATISGNHARVMVRVSGAEGVTRTFVWELSKQDKPPYRDCWMTDTVLPAE
jgi:hypothetical protein